MVGSKKNVDLFNLIATSLPPKEGTKNAGFGTGIFEEEEVEVMGPLVRSLIAVITSLSSQRSAYGMAKLEGPWAQYQHFLALP